MNDKELIKELQNEYLNNFGVYPEVILKAPGRINLIGEHTDYNGGLVLPAAIDKYIYFAVGKETSTEVTVYSGDFNKEVSFSYNNFIKSEELWINYMKGLLLEIETKGLEISGFNCFIKSTIPIGSGMSSSSAFECGFVKSIDRLFKLNLSNWDIVNMSHHSNHHYVGLKGGIMDQFICLFGESQKAIKLNCKTNEFNAIDTINNDYAFVLINTNVKHDNLSSGYNDRANECHEILNRAQEINADISFISEIEREIIPDLHLSPTLLYRLDFVLSENQRVLDFELAIKDQDYYLLGGLLYQSHEGLKDKYEVSCKELDLLIELSKEYKEILGARMMGGGFGGCTLNLIKRDGMEEVISKIKDDYLSLTGIHPESYVCSLSDGLKVLYPQH